jgi:hypothetical protein
MSAIARAPLGASTRQNRVMEMKTKDDPDTQMQVAKLEVKDQRRRRAEAEGMAEAAKRDSGSFS